MATKSWLESNIKIEYQVGPAHHYQFSITSMIAVGVSRKTCPHVPITRLTDESLVAFSLELSP